MTSLVRSLLVCHVLVLGVACKSSSGLGGNGDAGTTHDLATSGSDAAPAVDSSVTGSDGAVATTDFASSADFAGVSCGTATCGAGSVCCITNNGTSVSQACMAGTTCGDAGITAACDGPEDCSTSAPSCCADLTFDQTSMSGGGNAMCTASCPASATATDTKGEIKTKLCHNAGDCTNYSGSTPFGTFPYDHCCSYTGATSKFCAPAATAQSVSGVDCG